MGETSMIPNWKLVTGWKAVNVWDKQDLPWSPQEAGVSGGSSGVVDSGSGARQEPK